MLSFSHSAWGKLKDLPVCIHHTLEMQALIKTEPNPQAYQQIKDEKFYYSSRVFSDVEPEKIFYSENQKSGPELMKGFGIDPKDMAQFQGERWISLGDGISQFGPYTHEQGIRPVTLDLSPVSRGPHPLQADAALIPFKDESFDKSFSNAFLSHFFSPESGDLFNPEKGRQIILEMLRITKTNGTVLISPMISSDIALLDFLDILVQKKWISYKISPAQPSRTSLLLRPSSSAMGSRLHFENSQAHFIEIKKLK